MVETIQQTEGKIAVQFLRTDRIGQISGSSVDPDPKIHDPQGWPLLNDTSRWEAQGFDEGANTEHEGRLYFFSGDVVYRDFNTNPYNNSHLVAWSEDKEVLRHGGHQAAGWNFILPSSETGGGQGQPDWRLCGNCGGLFWDGDPNFKGVCVNGQGQPEWRFCGKCGGLFWNGDPNFKGVCPKGGIHSALGWTFILPSVETGGGRHSPIGWHFILPSEEIGGGQGQRDWRFCGKCGGLFWNGDPNFKGVCPKGGIHSALGWNFILPSVETGGGQGQPGWRFCGTCGGLFWDGDSTKGVCPGAQGGGLRLRAVLKDGSFWRFEADAPIGVTLSDEPASDAFSYGGRVYVFVGAAQAHWSGQTRPGDPAYGLYLVSSDKPDQPVPYRKEFLFNPRIGVCPADGGSHDVLGYNFVLQHDIAGGGLQESNWFRCRKCATLFQGENGQSGVCPAGGGHNANTRMVVSYGGGEDSLNQGKWRRCGKCQGMFWIGYSPSLGICPADNLGHQALDQIDYVFRHDQPEDANHQANWRRCRKCYGLFWGGLWMKGACGAGGAHDALAGEDIGTFLQDELILDYNVGDDATHQGNWRFCTKCYGLFFDGYQDFKGICPVDHQGHIRLEDPKQPLPRLDTPVGHIHPPVDFNFVLPHDMAADSWHEVGWRYCAKCALLFRGQHYMHMPDAIFLDNGHCPAGGNHAPAGYIFVLPHRLREDPQNDRDWRFCTKCFAMVSTKASGKFWTVASSVVHNSEFPGLPASESGDGLVILGYGFSDFYLAWLPLGGAGPRLQDTLYYTAGGPERWVPDVEGASGLFGTANLADPNHISMAWLAGPQLWILLYGRPATNEQEGEVVARIGTTLWDWSDEIPIVSPERSWDLYGMVDPGTWPYGPYILNRFTEWDPATGILGIYYLISLSTGYQIHLLHTQLKLTPE